METDKALTPMAFVRAIAHAYAARGMDPVAALDSAHIAPEDVEKPGDRISARQMEIVSEAAMRELDDEALGWFSRPLPWGSYGMLARASLSAPTLERALRRWCRHHGLLTRDVTLQLTRHADGSAHLAIDEHRDLGAAREFCLVSLLRNIHGLASWFIDSRIPLLDSTFAFAQPPHRDAYRVLFPGPVRFAADRTRLRFDARYLDLPLRRDEAALNQMLQRALPIMVLPYRRDRLLVDRVRRLLALPGHDSAQALAQALNTSPRTLHRHLQEAGVTLQSLKNGARLQRARDALLRSDRPIKQVAAQAGFRNDKSFLRAFKGWTGLTPAEFRERHRPPE